MALEKFNAPRLPVPPQAYDIDYFRQLIRVLGLYFAQVDSKTPNYSESYRASYFYGGVFSGTFTETMRSVTGTVTVADTDTILLADASGGTVTVNLPAAASNVGRQLVIKKIDSSGNLVVLDGNASETIDDATTQSIATQYTSLSISCDGTEWWII